MNAVLKLFSGALAAVMFCGCASMNSASGPRGPRLTGSGYSNHYESYAEVGIEFSSVGDFVAIVSPSRWKSPISTGGSLSWANPFAWSEDPSRTGRILLGEAVVVGGVVAAASVGGGSSGGSGSGSESVPETPSGKPTVPSGPGG